MTAAGRCYRIGGSDSWVASVPLAGDNAETAKNKKSPMAIHFVIDNSGSMGRNTEEAKIVFSGLVDSAATAPCSLTLFENTATLLSDSITTTEQMINLPRLYQGGTNIPAGVQTAMECIWQKEMKTIGTTHHVLVLLSDGYHNSGSPPEVEFPKIGARYKEAIPDLQLSVVVVGITKNSSTSMGMWLKTNLETVPMGTENIYFATHQNEMKDVLGKLVNELEKVSSGKIRTLSYPDSCLVSAFGAELTDALTMRTLPKDTYATVLIHSKKTPDHIMLDGERVDLNSSADKVNCDLIAEAIATHIDKIRVQRVASASPETVRSAVDQLNELVDALEKELSSNAVTKLALGKARGKERLQQHRAMYRTTHMARELRNELADVVNFSASSSEEQVAFLTGRKSKFANKALRRAAARSGGDVVLDPEKELNKAYNELTSDTFIDDLAAKLWADTVGHLAKLSKAQIEQLAQHVRAASTSDAELLGEIIGSGMADAFNEGASLKPTEKARSPALRWISYFMKGNHKEQANDQNIQVVTVSRKGRDFIESGTLAGYLNDVFFGGRQSYLSLSSPWEHAAEWKGIRESNEKFRSQWEMLLYLGSVAYPISVERSPAAQMNPFQMSVRNINTTVVDSASLCCANQSGVDTYGPEGGEPLKDALVLIDPSCPRASKQIASSSLLGETFTSVVISRDLYMYSGSSMKVALLANSLFSALQPEPAGKSKVDIVADIRRQFQGNAYQCGSCGFGPVAHGGCDDLAAHHGEVDGDGAVASNACPSCGWFSDDLDDWQPWDGRVPDTFVQARSCNKQESSDKPLQAKIDLMLRIVYSFRKQFFQSDNGVKEFYQDLAKKLADWDTSISTGDGIDGVTQTLIALMASDDDVHSAFAPPVILAIVNEACARQARKKFRMLSGGDEAKSRALAVQHVTKLLGITEESAPTTTETLLEPEPDHPIVKAQCSKDYSFDWDCEHHADIAFAKDIATCWCRALGLAREFRAYLTARGGGWAQLERDMETSLDNYKDVVEHLQQQPIPSLMELCDIEPKAVKRTLLTVSVQSFLYNKGSSRKELPDVRDGDTLACAARDMRLKIYEKRVTAKMAQWADEGKMLAFCRARACDIGQYESMINAGRHAHGLSKEMFWGLWEAAIHDGHGGEKVQAFLDSANDEFRHKHAPATTATAAGKKN